MSVPTIIPAQVAKLIPRLASDHGGEVVATARAIARTLKAAGLDFHELASAIDKPAEVRTVVQYRERYPDRKISWGDIARWCRDNDKGRLTIKERGFVADMAARLVRKGEPTERQAEWLRAINAKLYRAENAA